MPHPSGADPESCLDAAHVLMTATLEDTTLVDVYLVRAETVFHGTIDPVVSVDFGPVNRQREPSELRAAAGRRFLVLERDGASFRAGIHWWMHAPLDYFERNYPDFLSAIPEILRGEAIGDPGARNAARLRALGAGNVDLAAWAVRGVVRRWAESGPGSAARPEIEEGLRGLITDTSRPFGIRFYALMQMIHLPGAVDSTRLFDPLMEIAVGEPDLRARALMTIRVLSEGEPAAAREKWRALVPRLTDLLVAERGNENTIEEAARTIAILGGDDPEAIRSRIAPVHPTLAAAILDHWRDRGPLHHERFRLR